MQSGEERSGIILTSIKNGLKSIFRYSKSYVFINIAVVVVQGFLPTMFIVVMQKIINLLQSNSNNFSEIVVFLVIYILSNIANVIMISSYNYYKSRFLLKFTKHINLQMLDQAAKLSLKHYEDAETYNIINRAQSQGGASILAYVSEIAEVIKQFITVGSTVTILIGFRWWIVVVVLIIPITRCLITISINKKWYQLRVSRTPEERKSWYINFLMMTGNAFKEIKVLGISKYLISKYNEISDMFISQDLKMEKRNTFFAIILDFVEWIIIGGTFVYTVFLGVMRILLIGDVTAYIDCIGNIKNSSQGIFMGIGNVIEQSLYIDLLFEYLNIQTSNKVGEIQIQDINKIELKNVSFKYGNGLYALKKINMVLQLNSKVALIGENGSGKTTLIKLIMGLYEEYEGDIFVNDINLKQINIRDYQKKIGCVFQDYVQYEMTVRENIAFGDIDKIYDDEKIREQIKLVELEKRIRETDDLNLLIGNWFGGQELSIGEWQRIAIARALIKNANVYIFDEPDASLDILKQKELINVYKRATENKILIYVSHKINYVHLLANQIYVLVGGEIIESGKHETLMNSKLYYYDLFKQCESE